MNPPALCQVDCVHGSNASRGGASICSCIGQRGRQQLGAASTATAAFAAFAAAVATVALAARVAATSAVGKVGSSFWTGCAYIVGGSPTMARKASAVPCSSAAARASAQAGRPCTKCCKTLAPVLVLRPCSPHRATHAK